MAMSDDEIAKKLEEEASADEAREKQESALDGELITKQQEQEHDEKYKAALLQGFKTMGFVRGGIAKIWPYVSFGDEKEEEQFIYHGAVRHADVFVKYDTVGMPEWMEKWMPEIKLGILYGTIGFTMWLQIMAHKQAEAEKQEAGKDGEKSESSTQE